MKKNLGKIIILLLALQSIVFATQLATYTLTTNKKVAVIKEPIEVIFRAQQLVHNDVMFFFVTPHKSKDYTIKLLTKTIDDKSYHHTTATFKYIVFPLTAKKIKLNFDFSIKTASDKSIAHAYVEDHDQSQGIEGDMHTLTVKPITIMIKPLTHSVDLVGDFQLTSKIDTSTIDQYGSVNLRYILVGNGYDNKSLSLLHPIKGVTIFSDVNTLYSRLTQEGLDIKREYIYSLSAKKYFTVQAITLSAYSPTKKKYYTLKTPKYPIMVNKVDTSKFLDKEESPKKNSFIQFATIKQAFIYLFIFLSGYILAKLTQNGFLPKRAQKRFQDIYNAKSPQELVNILLKSYENYNLHSYIDELELLAYKKEGRKFESIKKSLLESVNLTV